MTDPKYVRLTDRLVQGCQVDLSTGWSIAGLDVQEFPSDESPRAQVYVRTLLQRGVLEYASAAEFEEVATADHDFLAEAGIEVEAPKIEGYYQESKVVGAAEARRREIESSRGLVSGGLSFKNDVARREALVKAQDYLDGLGDDEGVDDDELSMPEGSSPMGRHNVGGDPEKSGEDADEVAEATGGKGFSDDDHNASSARASSSKSSTRGRTTKKAAPSNKDSDS